ncbi:hypothetical protein BHM03_00052596 [Ensete ventricosum]|nr:hypothetical protein BHM03_00052596 [Ensete ventricosum]
MPHARPQHGRSLAVPTVLNTPAEDAAKTDGKGTISHRQTGIKATPGGLSRGGNLHSHNTYKRKFQRQEGAGDTPIYKANLAIKGASLGGLPPRKVFSCKYPTTERGQNTSMTRTPPSPVDASYLPRAPNPAELLLRVQVGPCRADSSDMADHPAIFWC